jgi:hypothetical protein
MGLQLSADDFQISQQRQALFVGRYATKTSNIEHYINDKLFLNC